VKRKVKRPDKEEESVWFQQGEGEGGLFADVHGKDAIMSSLNVFNKTVHVGLSSARMCPAPL